MENIENLKDNSVHLENVSQDDVGKFADSNAQLGAQLMEDERHLGVWANAKLHKRALLVCMCLRSILTTSTDADFRRR